MKSKMVPTTGTVKGDGSKTDLAHPIVANTGSTNKFSDGGFPPKTHVSDSSEFSQVCAKTGK